MKNNGINVTIPKKAIDIALSVLLVMVFLGGASGLTSKVAASAQARAELASVPAETVTAQPAEADAGYDEYETEAAVSTSGETESSALSEAASYEWTEWSESAAPDYYKVNGSAATSYDVPANGGITYNGLDELGRTTWAAGIIAKQMRTDAKAAGRQSFDASCDKISGWGHNAETVIASANGTKSYNGWFYNRSHLIADSLGGAAAPENLVTGTRCQNVGNSDNKGGMAYTEELVRAYLDNSGSWVYYAATPVYEGDELVPRSVIVDVLSDDGSIDIQVEVFNVAKGHVIDYATGEFK